jgi:AcrR family transcriptional regulator
VSNAKKKRTLQSRKASNTRYRILEGVLDCLVEIGYANTSISTIAERAGISRGAMQFHFPTKRSAMEAAINHLMQRRLDTYRADMAKIPSSESFLDHAIRAYWKQVTRPEFIALQELTLASRTDTGLAKVLSRAYREFVIQSRAPFLDEFPQWRQQSKRYNNAANLAQYVVEGMAWGYLNGHLNDTAVDSLLKTTRDTVLQLLEDGPSERRRRTNKQAKVSRGADRH